MELAFAARFFPDHVRCGAVLNSFQGRVDGAREAAPDAIDATKYTQDGDCDVFNALCVEDALLKAVLDALQDVGSEDLHATKLDDHGDGLDSALRVWRGVPFR